MTIATVLVVFCLCMSTLAHTANLDHNEKGGDNESDFIIGTTTIHAVLLLIFVLPVNGLGLHVARNLRHRSLATFRQW